MELDVLTKISKALHEIPEYLDHSFEDSFDENDEYDTAHFYVWFKIPKYEDE